MAKKLKNVEKEICTLYDLKHGKKQLKTWKMRIAHCTTWNMAKKPDECGKGDMHTV